MQRLMLILITCAAMAPTALAGGGHSATATRSWPANPTWGDVTRIATRNEMRTLRQIAECEQPGTGDGYVRPGWRTRWKTPAHWRFVGGYGMADTTFSIGARQLGYPAPPRATPAQQSLVALIIGRRFGWSSWGCHTTPA